MGAEVLPPGARETVDVEEGFVHDPHLPGEDCPLGDDCESPMAEWGYGPPSPRPYLAPPEGTLAYDLRELRRRWGALRRAFLEALHPVVVPALWRMEGLVGWIRATLEWWERRVT